MSIHTCKIYKILNRVQESENVMIPVDSYPEKEQKIKKNQWNTKFYVTSHRERSKIARKSLIRVDSYRKIDKYLKKAYPKDF